MTRRPWAGAAGVLLLLAVWAPPVFAQPKKILILRSGNFPIYDFAARGFIKGIAASPVSYAVTEAVLPKEEEVPAFMADLRAAPPDLVFTIGTQAARAVQEKGGGVPYTYSMIVDPPSLGLGGGGAVMEAHPARQINFIRENFPTLKRIGVIHSGERNQGSVKIFRDLAKQDGGLVLVQAESPEQMSNAIQRLAREADCLLMVADAMLYSPQTITQIILQTLQLNLPLIAVSPSFVKAGALAALYPDYEENGALAAEAAVRHFKGEPLRSMPVLWPEKSLSAVNTIVAARLNISVPERTLNKASEVVR